MVWLLAAAMLAGTLVAASTQAAPRRPAQDPYSIMAPEPGAAAPPEPWLPPRYQSPRGLPQQPGVREPPPPVPPPSVQIHRPAPPIVLPNGQVVPNLPPLRQGVVPDGGTETFSDRASRCATQSAINGVPADQQSTYMNSCTTGR